MPKVPKILMVARDAAPSRAFQKLAPVLKDRGYEVGLMVGDGNLLPQSDPEVLISAKRADLVLTGLSYPEENAKPEIMAARQAKEIGIPFGFYGDLPDSWFCARDGGYFSELAQEASFYLGINHDPSVRAEAQAVFPLAKIFDTGNPLREEMSFPEFTRAEVRGKLGIGDDEKMVMAPGSRFVCDGANWVMIMEALAMLSKKGHKFRLIMTPHPGDAVLFASDSRNGTPFNLYEQLADLSPVPTQFVRKNPDDKTTWSSNIVPGADILIQLGSSIGLEAACQGIPVIAFGFEVIFIEGFERSRGNRKVEQVERGLAELVVSDPSRLAEAVERLLTPDGYAPLRRQQQKECPTPKERGASLRKMAEALEEVLKAQ